MKTYSGHAFFSVEYGSVGSAHHRSPPCCLQQPRGILWGLELSLLGAQERWRASAHWRNGNLQEGRGRLLWARVGAGAALLLFCCPLVTTCSCPLSLKSGSSCKSLPGCLLRIGLFTWSIVTRTKIYSAPVCARCLVTLITCPFPQG